MVRNSCKKLIREYEDTIKWLRANNEDGHHNKNIERRERELARLKANPF